MVHGFLSSQLLVVLPSGTQPPPLHCMLPTQLSTAEIPLQSLSILHAQMFAIPVQLPSAQ